MSNVDVTGFSTESGSRKADRVRLLAQPLTVLVVVGVRGSSAPRVVRDSLPCVD